MKEKPWKLFIDTGGTFTDAMGIDPQGRVKKIKVLSSSVLRLAVTAQVSSNTLKVAFPSYLHTDFMKGFHVVMGKKRYTIQRTYPELSEIELASPCPREIPGAMDITTFEEVPVLAARLLTDTALDKPFPPIDLVLGSTRGTNALLERKGAKTALVVTKGFRDLLAIGHQQRPNIFSLDIRKEMPLYETVIEVNERIASDGTVLMPLEDDEVLRAVEFLKSKKVNSVALALVNSYRNPVHEQRLAQGIRASGFSFVSLSHALSPQIKIIPRAQTAVVNAYLSPIIHNYIDNIRKGIGSEAFQIMSSAGGLMGSSVFQPKDSLLSGPAGGVMGALAKAQHSSVGNIITFDMGGTSTDVSLCQGRPDYRFECSVGGQTILSPSIAIETIAAGGGSICDFDGHAFTVGPQSAGADPGPACYGQGGPLTITDVNLLLGRMDESNFSIPVQTTLAQQALAVVLDRVERATGKRPEREEALLGFLQIANEKMGEALRKVSIQKGRAPSDYALLCFGGAGGQHACSLADMLDIPKAIVPYDAGLLSAFGMSCAQREQGVEKLVLKPLDEYLPRLEDHIEAMKEEGLLQLKREGLDEKEFTLGRCLLFLRLRGQETSLEVEYIAGMDVKEGFVRQYKRVYGHWIDHLPIEIETIRIILRPKAVATNEVAHRAKPYVPVAQSTKKIHTTGGWGECPVHRWESLRAGASFSGPALVVSSNSTLWAAEGWDFFLEPSGNAILTKKKKGKMGGKVLSKETQLALYTNRFTGIAYDMGALLQRTSFSVNIKERLDFSCALLDARGALIVNAPHIPVHLGSLGVCVRTLMKTMPFAPGDVVLTNHPAYGGSHLPDLTLVKPVYYKRQLLGFVANRAHHAEIGGKKPGSMPADATCLMEEGVVIPPMNLMRKGKVDWKKVREIFLQGPYPTRSIEENLADLNGALASLNEGERALVQLCQRHGPQEVQVFMRAIKEQASALMRDKIKSLSGKIGSAVEYLDDGHVLKVNIFKKGKTLYIDFTGSSPVHPFNLNATPAIVNSVVLYVLRLWVDAPVPMNEGLLGPVKLILPRGLLNPTFTNNPATSPAVVGGNTEISQRLTDTLLKALNLAACSQGTMNNFLFGNERLGYYETIGGGTGAGPGFHGADGVHQHMTNTRITDPEILEHRYPVQLEGFGIRKGSGGKGKWKGGNGVERIILFKEKLEVNLLSQHRTVAPYGKKGGGEGKTGEQYLIRAQGKKEKLKGIDSVTVYPGDKIIIRTPGGGGWG